MSPAPCYFSKDEYRRVWRCETHEVEMTFEIVEQNLPWPGQPEKLCEWGRREGMV